MRREKVILGAALLAGFLVVATSGRAEAADRFDLVRIENALPTPVRFELRWPGSNGWRPQVLAPGESTSFWHQYRFPNEHVSPRLEIRYDEDMGPGLFWSQGPLQRYPVPDLQSAGKVYRFDYDGPARQFIRLQGVN